MMKDPVSGSYGSGVITSGQIREGYLKELMDGRKNVGMTTWGGNSWFFSWNIVADTLNMLAQKIDSKVIENYVLTKHGVNDYGFTFMSSDGETLGAVIPKCPPDSQKCYFLIDKERQFLISAGNQEPEVISQTFKVLQRKYDLRRRNFLNGLAVEPFECFLANSLEISQSFGGEVVPLRGSTMLLDLEHSNDLIRTFSTSAQEENIIPELKKHMREKLNLNC